MLPCSCATDCPGSGETCCVSGYRKRSREKTSRRKIQMRKNRKRRKRLCLSEEVATLKAEVESERHLCEESEKKVIHYKMMAHSYWERWMWELHQRKELMQRSRGGTRISRVPYLLEIDDTSLLDPESQSQEPEVYVGQGSFSIVKMKIFRSIKVAVKELQPLTLLQDVKHETHTLAKLCHPFLPYLFSVCMAKQPYMIVMQFHNSTKALALSTAITENNINDSHAWLGICIQIMEA